ncbi:MAG: hypothetical protein K0R14_802 [Burkholderiales bacterium]|jgi:predicted metal-dependent hydrolase|nr:hypothetical protein [Burkholderiales bacterium]
MIENVKIIFKRIKNINIRVKQDLEVVVTAPMRTSKSTINAIIASRQDWINKQLEYFKQRQILPKKYEHGEEFKFLGKIYPIKISQAKTGMVSLNADHLELSLPEDNISVGIRAILVNSWYKEQAHRHFMPILERYTQIVDKKINKVVIRQMKTRWGSCNPQKGYINLNLELIKKPVPAIEYIILHELAHLTHYNHDHKFYDYVSSYMPDWKARKKLLEF